MSQCWALRTLLSELLRARAQDVWEDAFKHAIEDHMNCKGAQGWERRWLVVYKSEIVRRHDTAAIWVASVQECPQLVASGLHSSESGAAI